MTKSIYWYEYWSKKKKQKNDFEKDFFKLKNNDVFGKTMENVKRHRDIKLVTTERRRNYLVSEPNYYTTIFFTKILMNKRVYLGLSIIELSKILTYEFWYDYVKPKYGEEQNCVIWIQIVSISIYTWKQMIFYKDNTEDVETRFDISNLILLVCFVSLKKITVEKQMFFNSILKAFSVFEIIKFQIFRYSNAMMSSNA